MLDDSHYLCNDYFISIVLEKNTALSCKNYHSNLYKILIIFKPKPYVF